MSAAGLRYFWASAFGFWLLSSRLLRTDKRLIVAACDVAKRRKRHRFWNYFWNVVVVVSPLSYVFFVRLSYLTFAVSFPGIIILTSHYLKTVQSLLMNSASMACTNCSPWSAVCTAFQTLAKKSITRRQWNGKLTNLKIPSLYAAVFCVFLIPYLDLCTVQFLLQGAFLWHNHSCWFALALKWRIQFLDVIAINTTQ